jgi:predicted dehydrogenase
MVQQAKALAPLALETESLEAMLALGLDGVVIATPSALHADQCVQALDRGIAVFCQKPLGRTAREVEAVLAAARKADRLLGVDLSYRHTAAMQAIRSRLPELGTPFAADLTFHNAYGPGAGWFWDPKLSGGGCLIDLGVHLVDLALWLFDFPDVTDARATLLRGAIQPSPDEVEDFATAEVSLANGVTVRIACSWNLSAGEDAVIEATLYGTSAGAQMRNENGSFFDFSADLFRGRNAERIASPPDDWGGRAAAEWVRNLAAGERFEGSTSGLLQTARTLDRLYGRS